MKAFEFSLRFRITPFVAIIYSTAAPQTTNGLEISLGRHVEVIKRIRDMIQDVTTGVDHIRLYRQTLS